MFQTVKRISQILITSIFETVAPRHCEICGEYIGSKERQFEFLCDRCVARFPVAGSNSEIYNRFISNFKGEELAIDNSIALMSLSEESDFIKLIYSLKYSGFRRVGIEMGKELGRIMQKNGMVSYDGLIPIPIHNARLRERGFNQSEIICKGISISTGIPVNDKIIKRKKYTRSQTLLSKEERRINIEDVFAPRLINYDANGKSFLLVDDVLTTGSTLNSAAKILKQMGASRVDSATLAIA